MKKGFTLIELLAVIVILAIIALIATPIILGIIKDAREKSNQRSVELYGDAVKNAIAKAQLDGTDKSINDILPTVEYEGNRVNCSSILYIKGKVYLSGCTVGNDPKLYTNVGNDYICTLEEGTSKTIGAKYTCNFDIERTFYVLEDGDNTELIKGTTGTAGSGEISLLMDRNLADNVAWCGDEVRCKKSGNWSNTSGPITANEYLSEYTSSWGVMVTLPTADQIMDSFAFENLHDGEEWHGSIPKPENHMEGIFGYWTSSYFYHGPYPIVSDDAYYVSYIGDLSSTSIYGGLGIRPVVTLPKELI